jgi:hypothetical protein
LLGRKGFYVAADVRAEMGEPFASIAAAPDRASVSEPAMEFVEL